MTAVPDIPGELTSFLEFQRFEAEFFPGAVWKLNVVPDDGLFAALNDFLRVANTQLVMCRINASCNDDARRLVAAGFRPVETLVTLARDLKSSDIEMSDELRLANVEDIESVACIARNAFRFDRFHADPYVPKDIAGRVKAAWAGNDVRSRADSVLLADADGQIAGFNACLLKNDIAIIDLIAVAPEAQGRGLGKRLIEGALSRYSKRAGLMQVGTQSDNTISLALYKAMRFAEIGRQVTFHWTPRSLKNVS